MPRCSQTIISPALVSKEKSDLTGPVPSCPETGRSYLKATPACWSSIAIITSDRLLKVSLPNRLTKCSAYADETDSRKPPRKRFVDLLAVSELPGLLSEDNLMMSIHFSSSTSPRLE